MNLAASRSARLKNKLVMRLGCVLVAVGFLVSLVVTPRARAVTVVDDVAVGAMSCAAFLESIGLPLTATVAEGAASTALVPVGITAVAGEYAAATGAAASGEALLGTVAAGTAVSAAGTIILTAAAVAACAGLAYWLYQKYDSGETTLLDAYFINDADLFIYPSYDAITSYAHIDFSANTVEGISSISYSLSGAYTLEIQHQYSGSSHLVGWIIYENETRIAGQNFISSTLDFAFWNNGGRLYITTYSPAASYWTHIYTSYLGLEDHLNIEINDAGYSDINFENQQMEITILSAAPGSSLAELVETVPQQVVEGTLTATYETVVDSDAFGDASTPDYDELGDVDELGLPSLGEALTRRFPFSIPWDIARGITLLAALAKTPHFEIDFYEVIGDRVGGWKGSTKLVLDFSEYEILGRLSRWTSTIGFCLFLASAGLGGAVPCGTRLQAH